MNQIGYNESKIFTIRSLFNMTITIKRPKGYSWIIPADGRDNPVPVKTPHKGEHDGQYAAESDGVQRHQD